MGGGGVFLFLYRVACDLRCMKLTVEKLVFMGNSLAGCTFCSGSRCPYVGDTGALIRLLLSLSSNLRILMEVETICLWMGNSHFATFVCFFPSGFTFQVNKGGFWMKYYGVLLISHSAIMFHYHLNCARMQKECSYTPDYIANEKD